MAHNVQAHPSSGGEETRQEPTIEQAVKNLLLDEEFSDISLQCTDGKVIRANRAGLAARNVVFHKMLYGHFAEANQETIRVGYTADVIQAVVENIYTNESTKLAEIAKDAVPVMLSSKTLCLIASAALFFDLPTLHRNVSDLSLELLEKYRGWACHWLEYSRAMGLSFLCPNDLSNLALKKVREDPSALLDETVLPHLSFETLEEVLKGDCINANELTLFKIIQKWHEYGGDTTDKCRRRDKLRHRRKTRQRQASGLTSYIRLENIHPRELASVVSPSGLVSRKQLFEAYKAQAIGAVDFYRGKFPTEFASTGSTSALVSQEQLLEAYKVQAMGAVDFYRGKFTFSRGKHFWGNSSDVWTPPSIYTMTTLLECPTMISGVFEWTVKVLERCKGGLMLGIASTLKPISRSEWLGSQDEGWRMTPPEKSAAKA